VWRGGVRWDLGAQGAVTGEAHALTDDGFVVGWVMTEHVRRRVAMAWEGTRAIDLNEAMVPPIHTLPWERLTEARDVDDQGRIIGFGTSHDGLVHSFLLTPIVEPN
jgi:uncharacterized membrane protein